MFLLTRDGLLNHCCVETPVICQPVRKFDMLTLVALHTMCSILFFLSEFGILVGNAIGEQFSKGDKTRCGTDVKRSKKCV